MSTNECSTSQMNSNNLSNYEIDNNMIHIPLYAQSKHTRQQAINEIADVILRSNMKPQSVEHMFQLLKTLLPPDNTLPATMNELFRAMMSSENDWRLAQYFTRHRKYRSLFSVTSNVYNENSNNLVVNENLFSTQEQDHESNSITQLSSEILFSNTNETESNFDNEDILSPYERLQEYLVPIVNLASDFNVNFATEIHVNVNNDNIRSFDQHSQSTSCIIDQPHVFDLHQEEIRVRQMQHEQVTFNLFRNCEDSDDETSFDSLSNNNKKSDCFEINGHNILNDSKRC